MVKTHLDCKQGPCVAINIITINISIINMITIYITTINIMVNNPLNGTSVGVCKHLALARKVDGSALS